MLHPVAYSLVACASEAMYAWDHFEMPCTRDTLRITGNDGGGSIRIPSALCGLVGLKPTFARIQDRPTHPYSSVGVQGPIACCVRDALLVYAVMANNGASRW